MAVHPPLNNSGNLDLKAKPGSIHDTDAITYRCFLPDLTRFTSVCCMAAGQPEDHGFQEAILQREFSSD